MVTTRVRPLWDKWYGRASWRRRRAHQLRAEPTCKLCLEHRGLIVVATVADHREPHHGDREKFERGQLISLCIDCHNGPKRGIEKRGYDNRIGENGFAVDPRHPCYAKRF